MLTTHAKKNSPRNVLVFQYHSSLHTMQEEPSYLSIILVSMTFTMVLTQIITGVYKDCLILRHTPYINILTGITILIPTDWFFDTIIDVWLRKLGPRLMVNYILNRISIRCYYSLWPHPHSMLRFEEHDVEFGCNRFDSIWSQSLKIDKEAHQRNAQKHIHRNIGR